MEVLPTGFIAAVVLCCCFGVEYDSLWSLCMVVLSVRRYCSRAEKGGVCAAVVAVGCLVRYSLVCMLLMSLS